MDFKRQQFFWSRVRKEDDHLIWTGAKTDRHYGKMEIEGVTVYAHKVSYCIAKGYDPADIEHLAILRICDRNDCVAPAHLVAKKKRNTKITKSS